MRYLKQEKNNLFGEFISFLLQIIPLGILDSTANCLTVTGYQCSVENFSYLGSGERVEIKNCLFEGSIYQKKLKYFY